METCAKCIHVDVCEHYAKTLNQKIAQYCDIQIPFEKEKPHSEPCDYFKDRAHFVELPCKVGEYIYVISPKSQVVVECRVVVVLIDETGILIRVVDTEFFTPSILFHHDIGVKAFFTKEEAEQALKERERK